MVSIILMVTMVTMVTKFMTCQKIVSKLSLHSIDCVILFSDFREKSGLFYSSPVKHVIVLEFKICLTNFVCDPNFVMLEQSYYG